MENSLFVALSRQMTIQRQMEIIANNLANADTGGFKSERLMFAEHLERTERGADPLAFVSDVATATDLREGSMASTGNPLDVAIRGRGWLVIDTPQGPRYTRDGHLRLDATGTLVNKQGFPVRSDSGGPIVFTPVDRVITIKADGSVEADGQSRGRIGVVGFDNPQRLEKVAGNLYRTDAVPAEAPEAEVVQGMIEDSNVEPVIEITRMMTALRTYQGVQRLVQEEHDREREMIRRVTQES